VASELIEDWALAALAEGLYVEIRINRELADTGKVELASPDGKVLWLEGKGAITRRLYMKAEQNEAWIVDVDCT
jgi:hypothetical protein